MNNLLVMSAELVLQQSFLGRSLWKNLFPLIMYLWT